MTAWCDKCSHRVDFSGSLPENCEKCGGAKWVLAWRYATAADMRAEAKNLSLNDRRFLRSLRISPEV